MRIVELEKTVTELSREDLALFRAWFEEFDAQVWDKQIKEDARSGRLDKLIAQANEEYNAGLCKPL
ncbi:MAG: hypothetical protein DCC56_13005 [Anaerolineae bacterium]|nr:MAG: hypothetical protein DCC56_13005 [Anaerolineae bacterium]WKZ42809.1 MAG: hypothetical protein QY302_11975 [Anaerolineales bacterium]